MLGGVSRNAPAEMVDFSTVENGELVPTLLALS